MKCLMPLNQRQAIAEAVEGKRYVEWGCGGTTLWLDSNARPLWGHVVEHNLAWAEQAMSGLMDGDVWGFSVEPCKPGANATIGEEQADDADAYIKAGVSTEADVYLIDGVVRSRCLHALVDAGRSCTVFIHDTQRDWYDDAIQYAIDAGATREDYPEGEDYPGCLLTRLELPEV